MKILVTGAGGFIGHKKFHNWKSSVKNLIYWYQKNML